ncbi:hypothetical protein Anapl_09535 [Anas platyrhynchos]|uniref:Uncharacterized protein n=1 Tax=Anas platyrhynchos TaxID=8839 RepID=R0JBC4_ANAPL|nr:hypothetical protein Anapl_09535 [Anas platyrhynchos]
MVPITITYSQLQVELWAQSAVREWICCHRHEQRARPGTRTKGHLAKPPWGLQALPRLGRLSAKAPRADALLTWKPGSPLRPRDRRGEEQWSMPPRHCTDTSTSGERRRGPLLHRRLGIQRYQLGVSRAGKLELQVSSPTMSSEMREESCSPWAWLRQEAAAARPCCSNAVNSSKESHIPPQRRATSSKKLPATAAVAFDREHVRVESPFQVSPVTLSSLAQIKALHLRRQTLPWKSISRREPQNKTRSGWKPLFKTCSFQGLSSEVSEAVPYSLELALAHYQDDQFLNSRPEILGDRYLAFVPTNTVTVRFTITRCFTEPCVHGDGQEKQTLQETEKEEPYARCTDFHNTQPFRTKGLIGKLPDATGVRQQQSQEEKQGARSLCSAGSLGKSLFGELASPAASRDLAWLRNLLSPAEEWEAAKDALQLMKRIPSRRNEDKALFWNTNPGKQGEGSYFFRKAHKEGFKRNLMLTVPRAALQAKTEAQDLSSRFASPFEGFFHASFQQSKSDRSSTKKPQPSPVCQAPVCWGELAASSWIQQKGSREGAVGAREPCPAVSERAAGLAGCSSHKEFEEDDQPNIAGKENPLFPHLFNPLLLPDADRGLQTVSCCEEEQNTAPLSDFVLRNTAPLSDFSVLRKTPTTFNITTFQPETHSCLKSNMQQPAKMTREG